MNAYFFNAIFEKKWRFQYSSQVFVKSGFCEVKFFMCVLTKRPVSKLTGESPVFSLSK